MKTRTCCSLILVTLLGAGPVLAVDAPPPPRPGPPAFADFDSNGDGVLTEQEFTDSRNKRIAERAAAGYPMRGLSNAMEFKALDSNGDGQLTQEEFAAHQRQHMQNRPMGPTR